MIYHKFTGMPKGAHAYKKRPLKVRAMQIKFPFKIDTLEGTMRGQAGDYLVEGIHKELYPVAQDIFKKTYMKVR
jgi:hypothetical protein